MNDIEYHINMKARLERSQLIKARTNNIADDFIVRFHPQPDGANDKDQH